MRSIILVTMTADSMLALQQVANVCRGLHATLLGSIAHQDSLMTEGCMVSDHQFCTSCMQANHHVVLQAAAVRLDLHGTLLGCIADCHSLMVLHAFQTPAEPRTAAVAATSSTAAACSPRPRVTPTSAKAAVTTTVGARGASDRKGAAAQRGTARAASSSATANRKVGQHATSSEAQTRPKTAGAT